MIPLGVDLLTFDFSGCGNSDGEWVTLGWKEKEDLKTVLNHLKEMGQTSKVALWGRSMGGSTAIMFDQSKTDLPICAMVIDSAFADFADVARNLVVEKMGVPPEFLQMMWPQVSMQINQVTGGMNMDQLKPVDFAPKVSTPALFVHGVDDELIPMDHTERN